MLPGSGSWLSRRLDFASGFTLIELMLVLALMSALAIFALTRFVDGSLMSLQSAQATLANFITAARTRAMATGQSTRLLVQIDPNSPRQPARFLRYLAVQTQVAGSWQLVAHIYLPPGVYVVPGNFSSIPTGLFPAATAASWVRSDGVALRSTALRSNQITSESINSPVPELWVGVTLAAAGTTVQSGDLILAAGRVRAPGTFAIGDSPVELPNAEAVRGLTLSSYGVATLINGRTSF